MAKNLQFGCRAGLAIFGILFVLLLANPIKANNELSITNLVVSPQPVYAGQNVMISFQLYNNDGNIQSVDLGLAGNYPLLNYSPAGTTLISSMGPGLYNGESYYFIYHLKIPPNIQSGTYALYLEASYDLTSTSTPAVSSDPISFYISGAPEVTLSASPTSPIIPGTAFTADITALNSGTAGATNTNITILNSANFSVAGASTFNLGTINAGASATSVITLQPVSTLPQGTNYIPVLLKYTTPSGQIIATTEYVPVSVVVNQPNLVPSIVSAQPQLLYSGSNQTLTVSIQNIGTGVAKNVSIRFLSTGNLTVGGSASDIFVGSIQAGASSSQTVFINANKNANQTSYQLPVALTYYNANYQSQMSKVAYINVNLQPSAKFNITSVSDALYPGATNMPLTFRIKNLGSETAQQVTLSLQTIYPITPVNPDVYISNLAPGQSGNATFYVSIESQGSAGQYPVTLDEQWTQPNGATNQQYSGANNYYAAIYKSAGAANPASAAIEDVIVLIVIVAIAIFAYRRFGKKAQAKKQSK